MKQFFSNAVNQLNSIKREVKKQKGLIEELKSSSIMMGNLLWKEISAYKSMSNRKLD